jgi:uncharacterized YigZ family protein
MSGMDYFTLRVSGADELIERESRFIGQAAPAGDEETALKWISETRGSHKAASHHPYAYILGENAGVMRYGDDGEPQGTAGLPIIETLRKNRLVNCVCVVTRYFGGVLLGAGGLARAYGRAAALAVKSAAIVLAQLSVRVETAVSYPSWDRLRHALESLPVCGVQTAFTNQVNLSLTIREKDVPALEKELAALTLGSAALSVSIPFFWLWPAGESDNPLREGKTS